MRNWIDIIAEAATAWHGSPHALGIDALRASKGGELGPGLYFSYDHRTAAGYARTNGEDSQLRTAGVLELDLSALNIREIKRDDWLKERARIMDELRANNDGEWRGEFYDASMATMIEQYEAEGVDGIYDDWRQGVVFPGHTGKIKIINRTAI